VGFKKFFRLQKPGFFQINFAVLLTTSISRLRHLCMATEFCGGSTKVSRRATVLVLVSV